MFDEILLTPMGSINTQKDTIDTNNPESLFLNFINKLEGWKTKCKNLHWAAPKKNIHEYLDDFLGVLSDYQDGLAEGYMGILGKMQPNAIKGIASDTLNAMDLLNEVIENTVKFYENIPEGTIYKGITSECETFIQNLNKYKYLSSLSDIRPY